MASIKESSDELNPSAQSAAAVAPPARRSAIDYVALAIATCGVGYFPIAPGTMGALVGAGLSFTVSAGLHIVLEAYARRHLQAAPYILSTHFAFMLLACLLVTMIGIWAASRSERLLQKKDPSIVVIDEVAGQMIALLTGPLWVQTWWGLITAFVFFRLFDIWKPYPIRRLEALESGLGIMADDVLAGIYAVIVNLLLIAGYFLIFTPRA